MSDDERAKALFFEAVDLLDASDFAGAEARLREALDVVPERPSALVNLSLALLPQQKLDEAETVARRATEVAPDDGDTWAALASVGATFPARAATSILLALDMPELVTQSIDASAGTAIRLARTPPELARIRDRIAANRAKAPLFDTALFTARRSGLCADDRAAPTRRAARGVRR